MNLRKFERWFTYPLTRPYPFRWFAYAVLLGGLACATLFSFVALAADGYNLDLTYTTDLNTTLDQQYWFDRGPFSWISKTRVSCQPALLTAGDTFFTTNLGRTYTINDLWRANSMGEKNRVLPAAAYQNTILRDCEVRRITIDFARHDDTREPNSWWSWGLTSANAGLTCTFDTPSGVVKANLTTTLPQVRNMEALQSTVISANVSDGASMWFGFQFTRAWYVQIPVAAGWSAPLDGISRWDSESVTLQRNPSVNDYTSTDFFNVAAIFFTDNRDLNYLVGMPPLSAWADLTGEGYYRLPNISATVDGFGKSFYSLLLSDFSVMDRSNALASPAGVQWLGSHTDSVLLSKTNGVYGRPGDVDDPSYKQQLTYPIDAAWQNVVDELGHAPELNNTEPSTIFAQYLCSIPIRKDGGALFFAVLLADLIFLQTAWQLLNVAAGCWMEGRYKDTNVCEGCLMHKSSLAPSHNSTNGQDDHLASLDPATDDDSIALVSRRRY